MANKILRTIAVATATGAAFGLGSIFALANRPRTAPAGPDNRAAERKEELERLLARLAVLEQKAESAPVEISTAVDTVALRVDLAEKAAVEREAELRALVESGVEGKMEAFRENLREELAARQDEAMAAFATSMDAKVSGRINEVEQTLAEQLVTLESVATSNAETGRNVERLVNTMERLMARIQNQPQAQVPAQEAPVEDSGKLNLPFRSKVILEPESAKPRKPMARMM